MATIEEEIPLFMTGVAYGAAAVLLFVVVPLIIYIRRLRKDRRKAWNEAFEGRAKTAGRGE